MNTKHASPTSSLSPVLEEEEKEHYDNEEEEDHFPVFTGQEEKDDYDLDETTSPLPSCSSSTSNSSFSSSSAPSPFTSMLRDMWKAATLISPHEIMDKQAQYISVMKLLSQLEQDPNDEAWNSVYTHHVRPLLVFATRLIRIRPSRIPDLPARYQTLFRVLDREMNDAKRRAGDAYNRTLHLYPFFSTLNNLRNTCMQLDGTRTYQQQAKFLTALSLLKDRAREHTLCQFNNKFDDESLQHADKAVFWLDFEVGHFRPLVQEYMQIIREQISDSYQRLPPISKQLFASFRVLLASSGGIIMQASSRLKLNPARVSSSCFIPVGPWPSDPSSIHIPHKEEEEEEGEGSKKKKGDE